MKFYYLILFAYLFSTAQLSAQVSKTYDLPNPRNPDYAPKLISASNLAEFSSLLIPEVAGLVKSGQIEIEAAADLKYTVRFSDAWENASAAESKATLDQKGELDPAIELTPGFIFGNSQKINSNDPSSGQKLLWNTISLYWSKKAIEAQFRLLRDFSNEGISQVEGDLRRIYPNALEQKAGEHVLFRELIKINSPTVLNDYSWLTFRLFGDQEDWVWVYSPAIHKSRTLTGSTRSDAFVASTISTDDFFVWSGKPALVTAKIVSEQQLLVPFVSLDMLKLSKIEDGCIELRPFGDKNDAPSNRYNYESNLFPGAAPWAPTGVVFVPRQVFRLELTSVDPFSSYGRQELYIDKELMLPVYKIVSDRIGRAWKTVIGSAGLAASEDRGEILAFNASVLVKDSIKDKAAVLDFESKRFCAKLSAEKFKEFDPSKLSPIIPTTPSAAPTS